MSSEFKTTSTDMSRAYFRSAVSRPSVVQDPSMLSLVFQSTKDGVFGCCFAVRIGLVPDQKTTDLHVTSDMQLSVQTGQQCITVRLLPVRFMDRLAFDWDRDELYLGPSILFELRMPADVQLSRVTLLEFALSDGTSTTGADEANTDDVQCWQTDWPLVDDPFPSVTCVPTSVPFNLAQPLTRSFTVDKGQLAWPTKEQITDIIVEGGEVGEGETAFPPTPLLSSHDEASTTEDEASTTEDEASTTDVWHDAAKEDKPTDTSCSASQSFGVKPQTRSFAFCNGQLVTSAKPTTSEPMTDIADYLMDD